MYLAVVKQGDSHQFCGFFPAAALGADFFFPDAVLLRKHLETVASWVESNQVVAGIKEAITTKAQNAGKLKGQYKGHVRACTVILEAVGSQDLWIWHSFFGMVVSHNDINVLQRSPVFARLAEGNNPPWTTIVKTIPNPVGEKRKRFAQEQESARKDVERAFGVLQSGWGIVWYPTNTWSMQKLWEVMTACVIMHNMIVEDERPERLYDQGFQFQDGMHEINSFEEEFVDNIWSTLSEDVANTMAGCVVSLASFNGKAKCFACTGLIIDCNPVRILTSASLVKISGDENKIDDNLQIEVYLNNTEQVTGTLRHYDLCYNVAVVEIIGSCGSTAVGLRRHISFTPNMEVLAVGRLIEHRKLMASRGVLIDRKGKLACEELRISTCKITKAGIGGPLIDARGNFVGMNFFHDEETPYLPREKIQEVVRRFDEERYAQYFFVMV
uniref:Uncharacterized protein n=1 Tax=Aegilops tauschii TaxID=37682 RepID=R7W7D5_AEGTA